MSVKYEKKKNEDFWFDFLPLFFWNFARQNRSPLLNTRQLQMFAYYKMAIIFLSTHYKRNKRSNIFMCWYIFEIACNENSLKTLAQVYTWDKCRLGKNKWLKSLSIRYVFFQQFARAWYCLLPLLIEHTSHHYNTNPIHWTSKWFFEELFYCIQKAKTCNIT